MSKAKNSAIGIMMGTITLIGAAIPAPTSADDIYVIEHLPDPVQARLEMRDRQLASYLLTSDNGPSYTIEETKSWGPGATVRVAFRGGDVNLRRQIAETASTWTQYANLKLDFGTGGQYREWSSADSAYVAEIRIAFDHSGYWSLVGSDSVDSNIATAAESSMNFYDFDHSLPPDWRATVLHEFGHALAFQHEHQNPVGGCDKEFRWFDDPDYMPTQDTFGQYIPDIQGHRPGVFTRLGGPPNNWPRERVESNLKQLPASRAFVSGPFDRESIMKYAFPAWMFTRGQQSRCYSIRNSVLSGQDKEGAALVYPRSQAAALATIDKQVKVYEGLLKAKNLPARIRRPYEDLLRSAQKHKKEMQNSSPQSGNLLYQRPSELCLPGAPVQVGGKLRGPVGLCGG